MRSQILPAENPQAIRSAIELLKQGAVVAFPTETVYGLGAHAFNPIAVARIFEIKQRPAFDPLIVHIARFADLERVAINRDPRIQSLAQRFWPGPLTLVLPKQEALPGIVTAGLSTVGVRIPQHPGALRLLESFGEPIAAPSANPFSYVSPTRAQHVAEQLGESVPLILDGGPSQVGVESTIVSLVEPVPVILRPGAITQADLSAVLGEVRVCSPATTDAPQAPGQLNKHYATRTPLYLWSPGESLSLAQGRSAGFIGFKDPAPAGEWALMRCLSQAGDMREAAAALFATLREADAAGLDLIIAQRVPTQGLGVAIMDRLSRCAVNAKFT